MNDAEIKLQVKIDDSTASKSVDTLSKKTDNLAKSFTNAGKKLTAGLTVPITALGAYSVKTASDLVETQNKVDVAFGDSADAVNKWGETTLKQYGIAKNTSLDMAATFGDMATGMGVNQGEAANLSTNLVGLAGDLASFKNISLDTAKTALTGVFTGETESLKGLGIIMTQTNLEQFALSKGINKNMDDMTEAEKIQLRYAFVVDRSKNAVGDFARTSDSTSNQMRTAKETFTEVSAELGENLLPIVSKLLTKVLEFLEWFGALTENQQNFILIVAGVLAALGPLLMIIGSIVKVVGILSQLLPIIGSLIGFLVSPIGLVIAAIGLLIAIIVLIVKHWDKIKEVAGNVFSAIGDWLSSFIEKWKNGWNIMVYYMKSALTNIKNFFVSVFEGIYNIFAEIINKILKGIETLMNGVFKPINLLIKGANVVPGVNIPLLKFKMPKLPKLNVGTNFVAQDGLAYLHQGEAVVPKKYNPALGNNNGDQPIVINLTTEAKVNEGTLFETSQRINYNKNLQTQFGG